MKNIIVLFLTLILATQTMAQDNSIIVLSCQGESKYAPEDGSEDIKLLPGLELPISGTVFIGEESRVKVIVNQKSVILSGPGRYLISDIHASNTKKSMSFSSRFWKFVVSGMGSTNDRKDLIKYHREFMQSHGGVKGFSEEGGDIVLAKVIRGKIAIDKVYFAWSTKDFEGPCEFSLLDAKRNVVFSNITEDNHLTVDLNETGLSFGSYYTWKVNYKIDGKTYNSELEFQYVPHKQSEILEKLLFLDDYLKANDREKRWMKAVMLEMEEYFYEADLEFRELLKNDSNNLFLQKSYALFLVRQNRVHAATDAIQFK